MWVRIKGTHENISPVGVALCPFLPARVDGDSMEPFVPQTHRLFQLCVGLGFVCCCPLGAKKTPKALSNATNNRMKKNAKPVSTSGFFLSGPWTAQVGISKIYFFLSKEGN